MKKQPVTDDDYYETLWDSPEYKFKVSFNEYLVIINQYIELFCILLNVLHLLILFQKPLRFNAVYIIMAEVCFFELLYFSHYYIQRTVPADPGIMVMACLRHQLLSITIIPEIQKVIANVSRRMFVWLMVHLAFIRTVSVTFPMSKLTENLAKLKFLVSCSAGIFLFWFLLCHWPLFLIRAYWLPDNLEYEPCFPVIPKQYIKTGTLSQSIYVLAIPYEYGADYEDRMNDAEGWIRVTTIVLYTFFVVIMIVKLNVIRRKRQALKSTADSVKATKTTILIILMTITFLITEIYAAGLAFWFTLGKETDRDYVLFGFVYYRSADAFTRNLRVFTLASHVVICYFMSTQYRETVHNMICCFRKKIKKKVSVIQVTNSISRDKLDLRRKKPKSSY